MGYVLIMPVCKTSLLNLWICLIEPIFTKCSHGSWKTGKVLEFYCRILQNCKVLEKRLLGSLKVLEICLTQVIK